MTLDLEILACGAVFVLLAYGLYEFLRHRKTNEFAQEKCKKPLKNIFTKIYTGLCSKTINNILKLSEILSRNL